MRAAATQKHRVFVETGRFIARHMTAADARGPYRMWLANKALMQGLNMPARNLSVAEVEQHIAAFDCVARHLIGLFERESQQLIGVILAEVNWAHGSVRISTFLGDRTWWGKSVLEELAIPLIDLAFSKRLEKIVAQVMVTNIAIMVPLRRLGFQREGRLRQEVRLHDGSGRADQFFYGLLKSEWQEARSKVLSTHDEVQEPLAPRAP